MSELIMATDSSGSQIGGTRAIRNSKVAKNQVRHVPYVPRRKRHHTILIVTPSCNMLCRHLTTLRSLSYRHFHEPRECEVLLVCDEEEMRLLGLLKQK